MEAGEGLEAIGLAEDDAVLIAGPPMTGKYDLFLGLLGAYCDRFVLLSTKHEADRIRADLESVTGQIPDGQIGIVDCVSREGPGTKEETPRLKYAKSPANLTAIGVKFTELHGDFYGADFEGATGAGIHSVSPLLMYSDLKQVYQFLQVFTGQVRSAGWVSAAVLDTGTADDEQTRMLQQHFDGFIRTRRREDGGREFRVRGLDPSASDWTPF